VSVRELQVLLGSDQISLNALYRAVQNGSVPSVRIGTRVLIPRRWVDAKLRGTTAITKQSPPGTNPVGPRTNHHGCTNDSTVSSAATRTLRGGWPWRLEACWTIRSSAH
jgi:hypothetical protein